MWCKQSLQSYDMIFFKKTKQQTKQQTNKFEPVIISCTLQDYTQYQI